MSGKAPKRYIPTTCSPCCRSQSSFLRTRKHRAKRKCLQLLEVVYAEEKQRCYLYRVNLSKPADYHLSASFWTIISELRGNRKQMCFYIYTQTHLFLCINIYTHTCSYIGRHINMYMHKCVRINVCIHTRMYIQTQRYIQGQNTCSLQAAYGMAI